VTGRPLVLAHRGGALEAPENTTQAFERAIRLGYDGVELDVRCSQDGVPMVVHDGQVPGPSGRPDLVVRDSRAADLGALPAFEDVLRLPWGGMTLMVEVKHDAHLPADLEGAARIARAIARTSLPHASFASFATELLEAARAAEPGLPSVLILDDETFHRDIRRFERFPASVYAADFEWLETDQAALAWLRARNAPIWAWTIKDLAQLDRALALGVHGLITDVPGAVRARLEGGR
jgi:glycerophosphoryl diester phosphodiesterase